ncbi:MAG: DUF5107 domain-containing protein [Spirochaetaceae bacterium]|jgi:hypothetical protein|nr:DUF5107 domain-containing protein [Spirochaetaceae bacterium]
MKKNILLIFLTLFIFSCTSKGTDNSVILEAPDTYNDFYSYLSGEELNKTLLHPQRIKWRHREVQIGPDYTLEGRYTGGDLVGQYFDVLVMENDYVGITLLPDMGGRLLSYYYKPTGHEQLYQNPAGTPFGIGNGAFYYNWLMVYGGLFPTFPEPEHGKTWLVPWEYKIVEDSEDRVAVEMWYTDDREESPTPPHKFNNGVTGITSRVTYRLEKDSTAVEMKVELRNPSRQDVPYEYWTCITFAPGSEPGNSRTDGNARIVAPVEEVIADYSANNWMLSGQTWPLSKFDQLDEWKNEGILYAYPRMTENWYGVLNQNNQEAFLRIGDNSITPGLKFWTWGHRQGENVDPLESSMNGARPYIELWSGNSLKFFSDATLEGRETLGWSEYYYPTIGLDDISYANEFGAFYLEDNILKISMNQPGEDYEFQITSDDSVIWEEGFTQGFDAASSFDLSEISLGNAKLTVLYNSRKYINQDL